jgi:hypothetical protein
MKTRLLSLVAGTALIASISIAQAAEPIVLGESQMDEITAGIRATVTSGAGTTFNINTGVFTFAAGTGVTTVIDIDPRPSSSRISRNNCRRR